MFFNLPMFDIENIMLQSEIYKARAKAEHEMVQLKHTLETLVYWETLYNKENNIPKNSSHLNMLIAINNVLGDETSEHYFIDKSIKPTVNQLVVALPSESDILSMDDLRIAKTEMFMLRENQPNPPIRMIMKTETNGDFQFFMRTKYKNIETEKIIDASEYLMLTTQVNLDISRISVVKYTFAYNGNRYILTIDVQNPKAATLDMIDNNIVPDFIKMA